MTYAEHELPIILGLQCGVHESLIDWLQLAMCILKSFFQFRPTSTAAKKIITTFRIKDSSFLQPMRKSIFSTLIPTVKLTVVRSHCEGQKFCGYILIRIRASPMKML